MLHPKDTVVGNYQRYAVKKTLESWKHSTEELAKGNINVIDPDYWLYILDGWMKDPELMRAAGGGSE